MVSFLSRIASVPFWALCVPALVAILAASLPTWVAGAPEPFIEDEYGYLLSAQTFAEGRLTNPTHELWQQFETLHQIQVPSYNSKYPPGQSLLLAVGTKLGHPIVGVWLSIGLMIASIAWMLLAWFTIRWAWIGAWVASFQYVMIGKAFGESTWAYWSQSYWGGALAAAGGALMFGGVARLVKKNDRAGALGLGFGLLLLANTRPLEGLIACLVPCLWLLWALVKSGRLSKAVTWIQVVIPIVVVLAPGFYAMGTYNNAVTGEVTEMPWNAHYEQYCVFPLFVFQEAIESRDWNHDDLRIFHGNTERYMHERHSSLKGFAVATAGKGVRFVIFFIGPIFGLILLLSLRHWIRDGRVWVLAIPLGLVMITGFSKFNAPPHYLAPVTGLVVAWILIAMKHLEGGQVSGKARGKMLVPAALAASLVVSAYGTYQAVQSSLETQGQERFEFLRMTETMPGQHLVLISYGPEPPNFRQWLFNEADIDASRVVFARDSGPESRQKLLDYYPDRTVWNLRTGFGDAQEMPVLANP